VVVVVVESRKQEVISSIHPILCATPRGSPTPKRKKVLVWFTFWDPRFWPPGCHWIFHALRFCRPRFRVQMRYVMRGCRVVAQAEKIQSSGCRQICTFFRFQIQCVPFPRPRLHPRLCTF